MNRKAFVAALAPAVLVITAALPLFGGDGIHPAGSKSKTDHLLRTRFTPARPDGRFRQFQFRGVVFAVPASWSVQRADQDPFRAQFVAVSGGPTGPRLRFSDTVQLLADPGRTGRAGRKAGSSPTVERYEMPNAAMRGVVYVIPEAGISVTALVRTEAEARAADRVVHSARWSLPQRAPARS
jgi:hypothetical protein